MKRRRYLLLIAVLLLIAGATLVVQHVLFPAGPRALEVVSVTGDVQIITSTGESAGLRVGQKVKPGESVKTGHEGEAVIRSGDEGSGTVTLSEHTEITVDGVVDGVSRLRLKDGRVLAQQPQGKGGVQITGGHDKASVFTNGGKVAVGIDGGGDLSVATLEGRSTVKDGDATQDLSAGQQATAAGGKIDVGAIPTQVLLQVAWPDSGKTRDPETSVKVSAPRGARVRVNDEPVILGPDGSGVAKVKLAEGDNKIHVEADDVAGNAAKQDSGVIVLDTRPPDIHGGHAQWK